MERPFPAYEGTEPFVFVCYAHEDADFVYPEITRLRDAGFNIWYDEGISPGSEWSEALARHIEECTVFLFFVTPRSVIREHCRREVNFALEERCTILPVHLEATNVPSALKLSLSHRQAILRHEHSQQAYEQKLDRALEAAALGRSETTEVPTQLQIGDWRLDVANHQLSRADDAHSLDPKDLSVLLHLVEASPGVVSAEALLDRSWAGVVVGDNALHQVIGRLRRAFGDDARNPSYIETLPRRGYRLMVPVGAQRAAPEQLVGALENASSGRGIKHAVALGALVLGLLGLLSVALWRTPEETFDAGTAGNGKPSLAVLPLRNLSPGGDLDWLAEGISEQLRNQLRAWNRFDVLPGALSRSLSRDPDSTGADFVIDGFLQGSGNEVTISLELVDVGKRATVWSESFTSEHSEPLELQQRLTTSLGRFVGESVAEDALPKTEAAYRAYLKMLPLQWLGDADEQFYWLEQALISDSGWSWGWAERVHLTLRAAIFENNAAYVDEAKAMFEAHHDAEEGYFFLVLGYMRAFFDDDLLGGEAILRETVFWDPSQYGWLLLNAGLFQEAEMVAEHVIEQAPFSHLAWQILVLARANQNDAAGALAAARELTRLFPDGANTPSFLAWVLPNAGRLDEARELAASLDEALQAGRFGAMQRKMTESMGYYPLRFELALADGNTDDARAVAEWYATNGYHFYAGVMFLRLGDDRAADHFLLDAEPYNRYFTAFKTMHLTPELRSHPLLMAYMGEIGFTLEARREICRRASELPPETFVRCDLSSVDAVSAVPTSRR